MGNLVCYGQPLVVLPHLGVRYVPKRSFTILDLMEELPKYVVSQPISPSNLPFHHIAVQVAFNSEPCVFCCKIQASN